MENLPVLNTQIPCDLDEVISKIRYLSEFLPSPQNDKRYVDSCEPFEHMYYFLTLLSGQLIDAAREGIISFGEFQHFLSELEKGIIGPSLKSKDIFIVSFFTALPSAEEVLATSVLHFIEDSLFIKRCQFIGEHLPQLSLLMWLANAQHLSYLRTWEKEDLFANCYFWKTAKQFFEAHNNTNDGEYLAPFGAGTLYLAYENPEAKAYQYIEDKENLKDFFDVLKEISISFKTCSEEEKERAVTIASRLYLTAPRIGIIKLEQTVDYNLQAPPEDRISLKTALSGYGKDFLSFAQYLIKERKVCERRPDGKPRIDSLNSKYFAPIIARHNHGWHAWFEPMPGEIRETNPAPQNTARLAAPALP